MNSTRRTLIRRGTAFVAMGTVAGSGLFTPRLERAQGVDTFGTGAEWRDGVARETKRILILARMATLH